MTPSSAEQKIRLALPFVRLLQVCIPFRLARWLSKQDIAHLRLDAEVTRAAAFAEGVPCVWLIPRNSPPDRVLLYLHGGGFVYGLTGQHLQMVATLAQKMGVRALVVDYRLAPEHPFPAALDDCVMAYRWLLGRGFLAQQIAVAGDSAGGNLTITALMKLRDSGDPLPAAAACLSPVADLSKKAGAPLKTHRDGPLKTHRDEQAGFKDPLLPPRAARFYNVSYLAHNDARQPLISPVFGDWHALPPLLVHVGEDEMLLPDAVRIEALARAAGVDVRLEIYPRMWHVFQLFRSLPQAVQSLDDLAQFLGAHLQ